MSTATTTAPTTTAPATPPAPAPAPDEAYDLAYHLCVLFSGTGGTEAQHERAVVLIGRYRAAEVAGLEAQLAEALRERTEFHDGLNQAALMLQGLRDECARLRDVVHEMEREGAR